jgi:hypothetical protein
MPRPKERAGKPLRRPIHCRGAGKAAAACPRWLPQSPSSLGEKRRQQLRQKLTRDPTARGPCQTRISDNESEQRVWMTSAEAMHRRQCQMQRQARLKTLAHLRLQEMNQVSDTRASAQLPRIGTREELHWHEAPHDALVQRSHCPREPGSSPGATRSSSHLQRLESGCVKRHARADVGGSSDRRSGRTVARSLRCTGKRARIIVVAEGA